MARAMPFNIGYTIISGTTTGWSAENADTWVEYKIVEQSVENNQSSLIAYFYTAVAEGENSGTYDNQDGGFSTFSIGGVSGINLWNDSPYDYRIDTEMLIGSFEGEIAHDEDGTKTVAVEGEYTTKSDWIDGGNISYNLELPAIDRGVARVKAGGIWETGLVYARVSGVWNLGQLWVKQGGIWEIGK